MTIDEIMKDVTPLPWAVGGPWPEVSVCAFTGTPDHDVGCDGREPVAKDFVEPDAQYVVRAANSFPALVEAINGLLEMFDTYGFAEPGNPCWRDKQIIETAKAALTAALKAP